MKNSKDKAIKWLKEMDKDNCPVKKIKHDDYEGCPAGDCQDDEEGFKQLMN